MTVSSDSRFILIVDDNPTNLSVLSEGLRSVGFQFRVATNGKMALAQAERTQPELILLDVQMPGMDGFETCRQLKANPATQHIPVIFTTALADIESKTKGFAAGAVDYISKPFAQEEVIARVRVHLQLKRLTESLEQQVCDRTDALHQAQIQIVQQEKLSSLGELVAGVAHEINNPISFITSNIPPMKEYVAGVTHLLNLYQQAYPTPAEPIAQAINDLDIDFVLDDMAKILESMTVGTERIKTISVSLRNFARSDGTTPSPADLHAGLDSTLMILQHRLKDATIRVDDGEIYRSRIEVLKTYGDLPSVTCYLGQMNQVFMNILANAIDAIDDATAQGKMTTPTPQIQVTTAIEVDPQACQWAVVRIADNGIGIPESVQQHLFEPLFTTKPVGQGTGLGWAIVNQIVVEKHQGQLAVRSHPGQGTEFTIKVPVTPL